MKWRKKLEGRAANLGVSIATGIVRRLSPAGVEKFGVFLGRLIYRFMGKRRQRVLSNLELAFPEWSDEKRHEVMLKNFEHFGIVGAEFLRSQSRTKEQLDSMLVEVEGYEHFEKAWSQGKGVLVLTGHFGNWELVGAWMASKGIPFSVVVRDADDAELNTGVNKLRSASGAKVIARGNAARQIISNLRAHEVVAILPDQNAREAFIPFFGKPAGTSLGPGVLAERTKAPVIAGFCARIGPGQYRLSVAPELQPVEGDGPKGEGMMRAYYAWLEESIRQHPEQYLWMHDKWRFARQEHLI